MEKLLILGTATLLTAKEAGGSGFPLTQEESWQLLFVFVASLATSFSNEAAKRREGDVFVLLRFIGDVGLGVMAGLCIPLLVTFAFEHLAGTRADWRASVGLSILGAYIGRDALRTVYGIVLAVAEIVAKLKGVTIKFDPPKSGGEDDGRK